jgi:hypothetical protein
MAKINFELQLSPQDANQLAAIMGVKQAELPATLAAHAQAAATEYTSMYLGQKVFTRGSDIREYRLLLLIKTAFNNRIPNEQTVCSLFQCTATQARALIRSVVSKYQYDLQEAVTGTLKEAISGANWSEDKTSLLMVVKSESIVEALNQHLAALDGTLPQIKRNIETVSTYDLKASSYAALCKEFGSKPK